MCHVSHYRWVSRPLSLGWHAFGDEASLRLVGFVVFASWIVVGVNNSTTSRAAGEFPVHALHTLLSNRLHASAALSVSPWALHMMVIER